MRRRRSRRSTRRRPAERRGALAASAHARVAGGTPPQRLPSAPLGNVDQPEAPHRRGAEARRAGDPRPLRGGGDRDLAARCAPGHQRRGRRLQHHDRLGAEPSIRWRAAAALEEAGGAPRTGGALRGGDPSRRPGLTRGAFDRYREPPRPACALDAIGYVDMAWALEPFTSGVRSQSRSARCATRAPTPRRSGRDTWTARSVQARPPRRPHWRRRSGEPFHDRREAATLGVLRRGPALGSKLAVAAAATHMSMTPRTDRAIIRRARRRLSRARAFPAECAGDDALQLSGDAFERSGRSLGARQHDGAFDRGDQQGGDRAGPARRKPPVRTARRPAGRARRTRSSDRAQPAAQAQRLHPADPGRALARLRPPRDRRGAACRGSLRPRRALHRRPRPRRRRARPGCRREPPLPGWSGSLAARRSVEQARGRSRPGLARDARHRAAAGRRHPRRRCRLPLCPDRDQTGHLSVRRRDRPASPSRADRGRASRLRPTHPGRCGALQLR